MLAPHCSLNIAAAPKNRPNVYHYLSQHDFISALAVSDLCIVTILQVDKKKLSLSSIWRVISYFYGRQEKANIKRFFLDTQRHCDVKLSPFKLQVKLRCNNSMKWLKGLRSSHNTLALLRRPESWRVINWIWSKISPLDLTDNAMTMISRFSFDLEKNYWCWTGGFVLLFRLVCEGDKFGLSRSFLYHTLWHMKPNPFSDFNLLRSGWRQNNMSAPLHRVHSSSSHLADFEMSFEMCNNHIGWYIRLYWPHDLDKYPRSYERHRLATSNRVSEACLQSLGRELSDNVANISPSDTFSTDILL